MKTHVPRHVSAEAPPAFPGVFFMPRIGGIPPFYAPLCGEMAWLACPALFGRISGRPCPSFGADSGGCIRPLEELR